MKVRLSNSTASTALTIALPLALTVTSSMPEWRRVKLLLFDLPLTPNVVWTLPPTIGALL